MNRLLLHPENPEFQPEWALENITTAFFKCIRWQVEETTDPINCPYHYFCDSTYPGNYPPAVDIVVLLFTTASYLATLVITIADITSGRRRLCFNWWKIRYWLPSGPIALPFILLALAKGLRINTIFPLSFIGPAILQLLQISALAFEIEADMIIKNALFELSTVSGVLQASLYLDSIILPYYTGLDALVSSNLSGECLSCVCRKQVLVVGGRFVLYRGWSVTMFTVVGTLCLRIFCRLSGHNSRKAKIVKTLLESLGWILVATDSAYLMINSPQDGFLQSGVAYGCVLVLICLHVLRKVCIQLACPTESWASKSVTGLREES